MNITNSINPNIKSRLNNVPDIITFHYKNGDIASVIQDMTISKEFTNFAVGEDGEIMCFGPVLYSAGINKTTNVITDGDRYYGRSRSTIIRSRNQDANLYTTSIAIAYPEDNTELSEDCIQSVI